MSLVKSSRRIREHFGRALKRTLGLETPRNFWIATGAAVAVTIATAVWLLPVFDDSDKELKNDLAALIVNPPGTEVSEAFVSASSNPLPNEGFPHGRGIVRADFPRGYRFQGQARPTFDSYLEGPAEFADERHFLRACFWHRRPNLCLSSGDTRRSGPLEVAPGDLLLISALVDNNGDPSGNREGAGPAVAHDSRVLFAYPTGMRSRSLSLSSYLYAANAVVDESRRRLRTVSDNFGFTSATGKPISLEYVPDEAVILQARHRRDPEAGEPEPSYVYQAWLLTGDQQRMMFTGNRRLLQGNTETDPELGLPIGSIGSFDSQTVVGQRQDQRLDFFAGERYHLFVQFKVRVRGRW